MPSKLAQAIAATTVTAAPTAAAAAASVVVGTSLLEARRRATLERAAELGQATLDELRRQQAAEAIATHTVAAELLPAAAGHLTNKRIKVRGG